MKNPALLAIILIAAASLTGCTKDSETDIRDSIVATYSVTETWTENSNTITKPAFTMIIEKSSRQADMVLLNNFADYGAGVTAEATLIAKDITIPQQTLPNSKKINGSGSVTDSTLTFTYTESFNSISIIVSATAKKR